MIASDKEGEVLAFGTTVPYITTKTPTEELHANMRYLLDKLVKNHEDFYNNTDKSSGAAASIPIPIQASPTDTVHDLQMCAMSAVVIAGQILGEKGYAILSVTPVVMSSDGTQNNAMVGYLVCACNEENKDRLFGDGSTEKLCHVWSEQGHLIYGRAAVDNYQQHIQGELEAMFSSITKDAPTPEDPTVH